MPNESLERKFETLAGEFINDFQIRASDEATVEEYKNTVNAAFVHYKQLLEDYSWALGLTQIIERHLKNDMTPSQQRSTPGTITAAENRLQRICRWFIERLHPEHGKICERYLQLRKTSIDIGSAYCIRHGMEFTSVLLKGTGLTNGWNGSEDIEIHTM